MSTELMSMALDLGAAENSLEHHGIEGQEWGKRNGPPYPLRSNQLSEEERRKNPSGSNELQKEEKTKKTIGEKIAEKKARKEELQKQEEKRKKQTEIAAKRARTIEEKKKAAAEQERKEVERKDKLYKYSAEELLDHRLEYSSSELADAINKLKQANDLHDVAIAAARKNQESFQQKIEESRRGAEKLQTLITYGDKAIKIYNTIATLSGEPTLESIASIKLEEMKAKAKEDREIAKKEREAEMAKARAKEKEEAEKARAKQVEEQRRKDERSPEAIKKDVDEVKRQYNEEQAKIAAAKEEERVKQEAAVAKAARETRIETARHAIMDAYATKANANKADPSDSRNTAVTDVIRSLYASTGQYKDIRDDEIQEAWRSIPKEYLDLFKS